MRINHRNQAIARKIGPSTVITHAVAQRRNVKMNAFRLRAKMAERQPLVNPDAR